MSSKTPQSTFKIFVPPLSPLSEPSPLPTPPTSPISLVFPPPTSPVSPPVSPLPPPPTLTNQVPGNARRGNYQVD